MSWQVFTQTPVLVALVGLVGVVIGHLTGGWGKKKAHELEGLQASVSVLQAEYKRINSELKELRRLCEKDRQTLESERIYTLVLQQHIIEGKPPPPPTRAEALGGADGVS